MFCEVLGAGLVALRDVPNVTDDGEYDDSLSLPRSLAEILHARFSLGCSEELRALVQIGIDQLIAHNQRRVMIQISADLYSVERDILYQVYHLVPEVWGLHNGKPAFSVAFSMLLGVVTACESDESKC